MEPFYKEVEDKRKGRKKTANGSRVETEKNIFNKKHHQKLNYF